MQAPHHSTTLQLHFSVAYENHPGGCMIVTMTHFCKHFYSYSYQKLQTAQCVLTAFLFPVICLSRHPLLSCCNAAGCNTQVAMTTLTALGWITWGLLSLWANQGFLLTTGLTHRRTQPVAQETNDLPVFIYLAHFTVVSCNSCRNEGPLMTALKTAWGEQQKGTLDTYVCTKAAAGLA